MRTSVEYISAGKLNRARFRFRNIVAGRPRSAPDAYFTVSRMRLALPSVASSTSTSFTSTPGWLAASSRVSSAASTLRSGSGIERGLVEPRIEAGKIIGGQGEFGGPILLE